MNLRRGIVVDTHPEDNSVDLVMADDGSRLVGVQILTQSASTRTGTVDLPKIPEKGDKWDITQRTEQEVLAMVGYFGTHPVVVGFLFPQISQMTFKDPKRRFSRHQSDVYSTIDGDGNMELYHPSGTYIRIAESPEHEDLVDKNFDENLAIDRNLDKKVHFHIRMAENVASVDIAPNGAITVLTDTTIDVKAKGDIKIESDTHILMRAPRIDLNP